ncbi:MAG: rhomboid family intramembrane serine protease [Chloroflexi bacterium]|nr:rhomboid family intramembrane serine protease [Chloroflexota bacterium]
MNFRNSPGFNLGPIGLLIITNIVLYVAVSINRNLIALFGLQPATMLQHPWTMVTALFLHAPFPSIGHILGNMFTLYFFGSALIQLVREKSFLIVYFAGGILGNILFWLLAPPFSIAIGASGAVFAVGGALTVMRPQLKVIIFPIPVPISLWIAVLGGFLLLSFLPFVAWQGHLGGLVLGLAAGYVFRRRERRWRWY